MMNVYKSFQSYLGAPEERSAELKGIGSILSEVDVEAKQSSSSSQSLRRTLSGDMLSQGWMSRENSLRKSCSFYELSRKSYSECEEFSDSDSEDRSEEEEEEEEEDGDIFSMTDEEEKEDKEEVVMDKNCGDLWSLIQSEKKQQKDSESSFFALMAPTNKELKVDSSKWEPCKPYVHPAKRKSTLSDQSLRLCTESLGCESGTDCSYPSLSDTEDCSSASSEDNFSVFGEEEEQVEEEQESISAENLKISDNVSGSEQEKAIKRTRSFPPPLSSIARSDGSCIHMRSFKQDGRLLLKAVPVETSQKYLTVRREDGRLQLHLIRTQLQELSPEEEKIPAEHEFNAQKSTAEEKQLQQQQSKSSAFSDLSNFRRHVLRSEYQNPSSNKEVPLNLNMNSAAKGKSLLLKNEQLQGSNLTCSKEMNSFSKVPSAAAAYTGFGHLVAASYTGCEDFLQERPSQSLITSPTLLYYQPNNHNSAAGDFESKSLPKFPCNESFRRCQVRQWLTKFGEPRCIAIS
ncbi:hypothetical protein SUGI_1057580 [Cryptomeria japonica]|uniref:protein FAF-like, chloroplastic n=1 Tax=Cryptomeria japonica TaxID=3369 RepID=UPI0024147581|nr:protein FAF-like, chloroplastic [Cryptomeria japonica]GLJ49795.1 hypothetical protein SUGI_1057580 [Cryptomeria japonica]